jgi:hypothetical protein
MCCITATLKWHFNSFNKLYYTIDTDIRVCNNNAIFNKISIHQLLHRGKLFAFLIHSTFSLGFYFLANPTDVKLRLLKINNDLVLFLKHMRLFIWYLNDAMIFSHNLHINHFYKQYTWLYSLYNGSVNTLICNNPSQYYKSIEFIALL